MRQIAPPSSRTDADVLEAIEDGWRQGRSARQIHGALEADSGFRGRVPSLRTVQRITKALVPPDPSERWSLTESDPDEVAVVVPILAELAMRDRLRELEWLTKREARLLVSIHAAASDCPALLAYEVMRSALRFEPLSGKWRVPSESRTGVDLFLAFGPWRGEEQMQRLRRTLDAGFIRGLTALEIEVCLLKMDEALADTDDPIGSAIRGKERAIALRE